MPRAAATPPDVIAPMLAQSQREPFSRAGWGFELKFDGVRALIVVDHGSVHVVSRRGRDDTERYPEAKQLGAHLRNRSAVIDAEIVAFDEHGRPSFQLLQGRAVARGAGEITEATRERSIKVEAFDLLYLDGKDLTAQPLRIRKQTLRQLLEGAPDAIAYVPHVETDGESFFRSVVREGAEGMLAKRLDAPYQPGRRSPDWIKVKTWQSQTCLIAGFTRGQGSRAKLGALALAVRDGTHWRYCGNVGTGFAGPGYSALVRRLEDLRTSDPPVSNPPRIRGLTWIRPHLYCEVRFAEFTRDGNLRQPVFLGLRTDVGPEDCSPGAPPPSSVEPTAATKPASKQRRPATAPLSEAAEIADQIRSIPGQTATIDIGGKPVHLTNLDKHLWPEYTKRDLIAYYVSVAPVLLPYLRDRAVGSQVFPDGITGKSFWRKQVPAGAPEWLTRWTFAGDERSVTYPIIDSVAAVAWIANSGGIDIHPWHSRIDDPQHPDWAVFDIDPAEGASFADVVTLAELVRAALDHLGLRGYPKTTGQTGLQIYVPIRRIYSYAEVRGWVETVSRAIGKVVPHLVSWEWTVSKRTGRVRLDYTQNIINKTLASPYSVRPAPGAPVSAPIAWEELKDPHLKPNGWTIETVRARITELGDLFAPALGGDQVLPDAAGAATAVSA